MKKDLLKLILDKLGIPDFGPYYDYESKKIGGTNPYRKCADCGASEPQINGSLSGHFNDCPYVEEKLKELILSK